MVFELGDIVFDTLTEATSGMVGIYPVLQTNENGKLPFIAYRRSGYEPAYSKDLYSKIDTYYYSIAVVSDVYKEGIELAENIINALIALTGKEVDGKHIQGVQITNAVETAGEDVLFVQDLDFQIKITR